MSNTYRAKSAAAEAVFAAGVFEHEFSPAEEQDWLNSGLIELVPRKYKVLSNNYERGQQGDVIEATFLVEHERMLVDGGHLERVATPPKKSVKAD